MEKRDYTPVFAAALAVAIFLGFAAGGMAYFNLVKALKSQGHDLGAAREHLLALDQALSNQQHELSEAREQWAEVNGKLADAQSNSQTVDRQLTAMQSKLRESEAAAEARFPPFFMPAPPPDVAAADSIEGQFKGEGRRWEKTPGPILTGIYVQDLLEGRMNMPKGRGHVGKVVKTMTDAEGREHATVSFGRGFSTTIFFTELSPIRFIEPDVR